MDALKRLIVPDLADSPALLESPRREIDDNQEAAKGLIARATSLLKVELERMTTAVSQDAAPGQLAPAVTRALAADIVTKPFVSGALRFPGRRFFLARVRFLDANGQEVTWHQEVSGGGSQPYFEAATRARAQLRADHPGAGYPDLYLHPLAAR